MNRLHDIIKSKKIEPMRSFHFKKDFNIQLLVSIAFALC